MRSGVRTVWVVDDSPQEAEHARSALNGIYRTVTFADGSEVIERLAADEPPDVIVLDWVMPGVSGLDVCRFIRQQPGAAARVGVLLLTSHRSAAHVVEGLAAGANDYLSKPFANEELQARVASLIRSKELLERVESAEATVRGLLANVPDALLVMDAHGRLTYANDEGARILGHSPGALVGRPVAELIPDLDLQRLEPRAGPVIELPDVRVGDKTFAPTVRFLATDFAASTTIALRNVTERRRMEARRLDFYSIIAHDLRSPLSAVLLRTDLIQRRPREVMPAELIADIRKIENNVRSMVALINDFLDLARLEGGGYKLEREDVDAGALLASTVEDIRPLIEASRLTVEVELPSSPLLLAGERHRLVQVLTNLLSNAIKFTPPGGHITASARRNVDEIEIRVTDTGRGIPAQAIPTLFERYTRAAEKTSTGGTGLGLMIVREIVEAHGGTVEVTSQVGSGTTFTAKLPALIGQGGEAGWKHDVLVVDDEADVREALQFVLEASGYTVHSARDGLEALTKLRGGLVPRLVVLDVSMPVMTGPELLEAMRAEPRLARIPVCVMSGDLSALRVAPPGALVMQKPIQVDRLLDFLHRLAVGRLAAATASSSASASGSGH